MRPLCSLCHAVPALHHFWIDGEYRLICDTCQTPDQRAAVDRARTEA